MDQSSKPQTNYQKLGIDAEVSVETGLPVGEPEDILEQLGKRMTPEAFAYLGSAAFHVYATNAGKLGESGDMQVRTQVLLSGMSEQAAMVSVQEFIKRCEASFKGRERKSIDPHYKVQT